MKWVKRMTLANEPYTALVDDDERREFGRYWHRRGGFVPETTKNNARPRRYEEEARYEVARGALVRTTMEQMELEEVMLGLTPKCSTENVPRARKGKISGSTDGHKSQTNERTVQAQRSQG